MKTTEAVPMKQETNVTIKKADNGFVVSVWNGKEDKTYVYDKITDAISELESIFSVAGEEVKD